MEVEQSRTMDDPFFHSQEVSDDDYVEGHGDGMEEGMELAETICPKISRMVSTMSRSTGMIRSMITEVKCCWEHGSWRWASTVLGPNLLQPQDEDSEWAYIIKCIRTWKFGPILQLALLSFGSVFFPPMGFILFMFLWERSVMTEEGREFEHYPTSCYTTGSTPHKERWIFVNGMCLDNNLGGANAKQLAKLFRRPIGFFHNPTQGLLFDLFECLVGRTLSFQTPVSTRLAKCMSRYMLNDQYSKVVVICHSQGGIITSAAIDLLISRKVMGLSKVEVYTFGAAADTFTQVSDPKTGLMYPYYEHYANEGDYIAKIGTLHFDLPGNVWSLNREGHFLGEHYLPDFRRGLYTIYSGPSNAKSRLYSYVPDCNKPFEVLQREEMQKQTRRRAYSLPPLRSLPPLH